MKLHLTHPAGHQLITGYGKGWVEVNAVRHRRSLIVLPGEVVADWAATDFGNLAESHFARIAQLKPEIVLLGTGAAQHFVHPRLARPLLDLGIGLECMDTPAACRTYNILMSEGRHVLAALVL